MLVCLIVLLGVFSVPAFASPAGIFVNVDGQALKLAVPPVMHDDRVLVSIRDTGEALQARVDWDNAAQTVEVAGRGAVITLKLGDRNAGVNSLPVKLDVPAMMVQNRVMVPLGFIARTFGAKVVWDEQTQTVHIFTVPTGETVTGKVYGRVRVPLILPAKIEHNFQDKVDKVTATAGYWDLNAGKVNLDSTPLYNLQSDYSALYRTVWDGGDRICFSCAPKDNLTVTGVKPGYRVSMFNWPGYTIPIVYCPSGSQTAMTVRFERDGTGGAGRETGKIVVEIHRGDQVTEKVLSPPLPGNASGPYPVFVYGSPDDFSVLADCESFSGGEDRGSLLLVEVKGGDVRWKTVAGEHGSFIAGAGARVVKCGERIFIDDRVLDLTRDPLKLEKYQPIDSLMDTVKDKFAYLPQPLRPGLHDYRDVLLVSAAGADEMWVWAVQGDQCVGELYFDQKSHRLMVYHEGKLSDQQTLSASVFAYPILPEYGSGSWH